MKIRPLLIALLLVAFVGVSYRLFRLYVDHQVQLNLNHQREAVEMITRDASGLLVLMQDFAIHRQNQRALRQWGATHRSMVSALERYAATGPEYKNQVAGMLESSEALAAMQEQLLSNLKLGVGPSLDDRRETLLDQILNETRRISEEAFELSSDVTRRRQIQNDEQRFLALIAQTMFLMIILVLALILWWRVLRPIGILQNAAQSLAKNELGTVCGYKSGDELGDLAAAFDRMSSTLKSREDALQIAKGQAESASKAKSDFLANMSHEIRTPLNAIIGMVYMMGFSKLDSDQHHQLETIHTASHGLLALINDILDLSKIEAGEFVLESGPFSLQHMMDELRMLLEPTARGKGLHLNVLALPETLPHVVEGDANRIRQVLINLANNAIKFTERGTVEVRVEPVLDADREHGLVWIRFLVSDSGIGISEENASKLFSPFVQVDSSTARRHGGTGLGLSIVKTLVEAMGGRVGLQSVEGRGSVFWLDLPLLESKLGQDTSSLGVATRPFQVYVLEQESTARESMVRVAQQFGWDVRVFATATAFFHGVEVESRQLRSPDCVVMGNRILDMPLDDFFKECHRKFSGLMMPYWLITKERSGDVLPDSLLALPHAVLQKPVESSDLFNALNQVVTRNQRDLDYLMNYSVLDVGDHVWLSDVNVLVVDDSPMNLEVCRRILENQGAHVSTCESGNAALAAIQHDPNAFDLVLMDMQMPGLDGRQTTLQIREKLKLKNLPVIALTAGVLIEDREKAIKAGVSAFLGKPIDPQQLVRCIRKTVQTSRNQVLPVYPRSKAVEDCSTWPRIPGVDEAAARVQLQNDEHLYRELLVIFYEEYRAARSQVESLLDEQSAPDLLTYLHKLRGQAAALGATQLREAAQSLENVVRTGEGHRGRSADKFFRQLNVLLTGIRSIADFDQVAVKQGAQTLDRHVLAHQVDELGILLRKNSMSAHKLSEEISTSLAGTPFEKAFGPVHSAVDALKFKDAVQKLDVFEVQMNKVSCT
ncbi:MAG TPA: response regulator [Limnobacter sp.]|nr:response regulator [Limnobacter sp.]